MILSYLQYIIIAIIFIIFTKINTEKIFIVNTYKSNMACRMAFFYDFGISTASV